MHTYITVRLHTMLVEQAHHMHNRTLLYITPYTPYVHKNMHTSTAHAYVEFVLLKLL